MKEILAAFIIFCVIPTAAVGIWMTMETESYQNKCEAQSGHIYNHPTISRGICLTEDGRVTEVH